MSLLRCMVSLGTGGGYDIPPLLCCVVQSRDTVHVSASSLSPHLQPEGGREEGGETKEGGEGKEDMEGRRERGKKEKGRWRKGREEEVLLT